MDERSGAAPEVAVATEATEKEPQVVTTEFPITNVVLDQDPMTNRGIAVFTCKVEDDPHGQKVENVIVFSDGTVVRYTLWPLHKGMVSNGRKLPEQKVIGKAGRWETVTIGDDQYADKVVRLTYEAIKDEEPVKS